MFLYRTYSYVFIICFLTTSGIAQLQTPKPNLIIYDTINREQCVIQPFIDALNNNWNVQYSPLDRIMDIDINEIKTDTTQSVFFIFGIEFLKGLQTSSPISQKVVTLLKKYGSEQNKLIGLSFPSISINPEANLIEKFKPIFESFYTTSNQTLDKTLTSTQFNEESTPKDLKAFTIVANNFLARPLEGRPLKYHTTLSMPRSGQNFYTSQLKRIIAENKDTLKFLPENSRLPDEVNDTPPFGLYFINKKNHIFITQNSLLSFSGITENCHFCPMIFGLRNELLNCMNDTARQVSNIFLNLNKSPDLTATATTNQVTFPVIMGQSLNSIEPSLRKTAWMEINIFAPQDPIITSTKDTQNQSSTLDQQKQLISYIIDSKLDTLWISVCPNCFYSPIALQKHNEKKMLDSISNFTSQLKEACQKNNSKNPKILIGFEIANNLYNEGLPKVTAQDVYGNNYMDIPDPLNEDFWNNEVEIPLTKFVEQWNKPEIGNGIELSGVMLDLEMYGRKSSGIFLTTMGISQNNLNDFFKEQSIKAEPMTVNATLNYLMNNKLSVKYFEFLENKARSLGLRLKDSFDRCIPKCAIALYMPNILASWFYKGLYKGLCKTDQPLYLFSFNAEFNYHKNWFTQNNINAHHSSVLLLSKLSNSDNFKLASDVLTHHHGVWLNRFSRLIEKRSNDWTAAEKPMFPENSKTKLTNEFIQYLGKI